MSYMEIFTWELLGTAALVLIGTGSVATVLLKGSLAFGGGGNWLVIVFGWGLGVFVGASIASPTGGHINPIVTLALAITGSTAWSELPIYALGQLTGGIIGGILCWVVFKLQFDSSVDNSDTRRIFCTVPGERKRFWNTITEAIATFVLIFWILADPPGNAALGYGGVAAVVVAIGVGLGGPTGYAINPARDLGPRIAYWLLPIRGKARPDWGYAWVPVLGPVLGASAAALLYLALA
ncbi:MIP/aquaporin family protein [Rhodococcus sp. IEGM 1408]|uniref:MIP/aquaporin family protein n=1 Tax=Rhodococcus sp. IEGM 1408 TaxID=3082220 RepID=UPI0029552D5B|nr:MIP/aquaporin family protein [Rhodococcus sp. IEGM 1408]MDV8002987.1 MIP/aquaporin family protein [Rhodococcus sp. IEGM 1408]